MKKLQGNIGNLIFSTGTSFKQINFKLLGVLILMGLLPTIYMTVRIHFLGTLPGDWGYNIASQLAWLNITYEVVHESLILPMFFLIGRFLHDRSRFNNAVSNGFILTAALYGILSILTLLFARPMIVFMAQKTELVEATVRYIRLKAVSALFAALVRFLTLTLVVLKREIRLLFILGIQLVLSVLFDTIFLSSLPFSLQLGVNGIAITNIIVNFILLSILVNMLRREGYLVPGYSFKLDLGCLRAWFRVGGISGLESFVRNAAFILMVIRLVNMVQEQGTFWVTNNFIWGWLLVPVLALGELIKRDTAEDVDAIRTKAFGYGVLTLVFVLGWLITIPLWRSFMREVMGVADWEKVFQLSLISLGFYITFAFNNIADSIFYGRGRTDLMLYQSLIVNSLFYGSLFVLFQLGLYSPTLVSITVMFGTGIAIDSGITFIMYYRFYRRLTIPSVTNAITG
ncbi:hypothetical protein B4O97_16295 [Marispirochaeta aestuarii]|uniref:Multidrug transporter n=1 Tax=Marispirochaeta aestuarii TaxID=1963862 RepID=A0A1Y1RVG6_9SPIO|nr:MATE family Na+-driven efflux transporter [Marispirochaeta aestuarii]ORC32623.1 hypothetical protein B4O97_16295 [Marispirochaeta aestuarii]